jgi:hypothetical protein
METVKRLRKALMAGVGAGAAAYTTALSTKGSLQQTDWALVVGSAIVVAVLTYLVPNKPAPTE